MIRILVEFVAVCAFVWTLQIALWFSVGAVP
jgi:hypothetical protein